MENIRIVHIIPSLGKAGAERLVVDICNSLNEQKGISVKLVVLCDWNDYQHITKNLDIEIIHASYIPSITGKAVNNTRELLNLFNAFKPHIIHLHRFEAEIAARTTGYYGAAYVVHCHFNTPEYERFNLNTLFTKNKLTKYFERRIILKHTLKAKGNTFLAISRDTQRYFEKNLPKKLKKDIVLLLNAISFKTFAKAPLPKFPTDEIRLINVGTLIPRKNQQFLVRVLHVLKKIKPNVKLYLLGEGTEKEEIENLAIKLNCINDLVMPGNVERVEEYMANSHLYLHSATFEPFGLVLVEAMAAGLPIITLDGKGNRDFNLEGKTGFMLPTTSSPEEYANKIIEILDNQALYVEMSKNVRDMASKFDIEIYTQRLITEYKKLL